MLDMFKSKKGNVKNSQDDDFQLDMERIPEHIGIIMDGNGRWAKAKGYPRTIGHKAGVETIRRVLKEAERLGVKYLTLYAFSTENWKRPKEEVGALMKLLVQYFRSELNELHENGVVVNTIGDISKLPKECIQEIERAKEKTKNNTGVVMNLALNYGGRDEIVRAVKYLAKDAIEGKILPEEIDEKSIERYLYTAKMPDPDMIIRPSGEQRTW